MSKANEVSPTEMDNADGSNDDDKNENNLTYEQLREKRMRENMLIFEALGVNQAANNFAASLKINQVNKNPVKRVNRSKNVTPYHIPARRSQRIAKIMTSTDSTSEQKTLNSTYNLRTNDNLLINNEVQDDLDQSSSSLDVLNTVSILVPEEDNVFFEKLSSDLVVKEAVNDFNSCDFERFTKVLQSLEMNDASSLKVASSRIYSLAVHPSETSLLIAAGSLKGTITLYSKNDLDMRECRVHEAPVNCISFCSWDPLKLFSTSHDGSVRCGDIVKRTFDIIYTSDLGPKNKTNRAHTTWHTEYERSILVGNGAGRVDLIDTRSPSKIQNSVWCHEKSVRTVQCHPLQNHYFLTSSGVGEVALWDIRNMTDSKIDPVLLFDHPKALTSAFFSASGSNMVSTCNDDNIRIFNTSKLTTEALKAVHKIKHDNHTGRWLSVFKAKWHPGRDDAFFIGSMLLPKRIQIYQSNGNVLHNLTSENMTTYCPVIEAHPTQAIYVGGNSSGRLHIFSTEEQLK